MKKVLLSAVLLFFTATLFAQPSVRIGRIESSVSITRPDNGIKTSYAATDEIPEFMYGSKVLAVGGPVEIHIFHTAIILLEENQEIFITKDPITKAVELSKTESNGNGVNGDIQVFLAGYAFCFFGTDTKVSLYENYPSIIYKVIRGSSYVKGLKDSVYELTKGEYYEAKQNIIR